MSRPILIIDDEASIREAVRRMLTQAGYAAIAVSSAFEALELLETESPALIITDVSMPGMSGLELLERLQKLEGAPPAIVISGDATVERAVRAVRLGALDFVSKPVQRERLIVTVENALRFSRLAAVHEHLKTDVATTSHLVGQSTAMTGLRALIARVAPSDGRVLILGENGTGKELVAAAIHAGSERRAGPFITLNCAAVPESLVESELFGHEKGAFTSAVSSRQGRFELADHGTLFLDEVGDMPPAMQAKLLRVLQDGAFERVGGSRKIQVDVRVISATNQDVDALVDEGKFREDLLYRLNVVTIDVAPLRERSDDIPALVAHFLMKATPRSGRRQLTVTESAMAALQRYGFPGNVRELSNVVERAVILATSDVIDEADVAMLLPRRRRKDALSARPSLYHDGVPLRELMQDAEREILVAAIAAYGGKKAKAAQGLEVERSHFYKKCRQFDIE